jgi:hypothetical protein
MRLVLVQRFLRIAAPQPEDRLLGDRLNLNQIQIKVTIPGRQQ